MHSFVPTNASRLKPGGMFRLKHDKSANPTQGEMMLSTSTTRIAAFATAVIAFAAMSGSALAQKKYDTGATDTEIKVGNIMPYSGPASAYGVIGKTEDAYFKMINDKGGINGRKINFVTYDDGYSPPKAVEQVRKLVESDEVLVVFNPLGTPSNTAIQKYLNSKKVPQLFVATGATKWNDPKNFPWTIGWQPSYQSEAQIYAKWLMKEKPDAKVAILYQNDDFGKDYLKGTKDGFGAKASSAIIMEESYEVSEPTIDSHIVKIKAANPDVLLIYTTPKFGAQTIKKTAELGWKPLQIITNVAASVGGVMAPAGFENAQDVLSAAYAKDGADAQWNNDPGMKKWIEFLDKYMPGADKTDGSVVYGYGAAQTLAKVLEMCGDDLTRANVMKQAASLKDFTPDTLLPGVKINTSASDFAPIAQLQMQRFKGQKWELFGETISGDIASE
jgi:branched-chain amino acid transport system substrate-binding protein